MKHADINDRSEASGSCGNFMICCNFYHNVNQQLKLTYKKQEHGNGPYIFRFPSYISPSTCVKLSHSLCSLSGISAGI